MRDHEEIGNFVTAKKQLKFWVFNITSAEHLKI